jgi:hypothetical protein
MKERFKKYQWIEVETTKHPHDKRLESYLPTGQFALGSVIKSSQNWIERKKYILTNEMYSLCGFIKNNRDQLSLAIIKPSKISDFSWEPTERTWDQKQLEFMKQHNLFDDNAKPLEKIPYNFIYHFHCSASNCTGHNIMIEDWEVMELYRKMRDKYGEQQGLLKVKYRFFDTMCSPKRDTYFFVGTHYRFKTWIILGVFWPPKTT